MRKLGRVEGSIRGYQKPVSCGPSRMNGGQAGRANGIQTELYSSLWRGIELSSANPRFGCLARYRGVMSPRFLLSGHQLHGTRSRPVPVQLPHFISEIYRIRWGIERSAIWKHSGTNTVPNECEREGRNLTLSLQIRFRPSSRWSPDLPIELHETDAGVTVFSSLSSDRNFACVPPYSASYPIDQQIRHSDGGTYGSSSVLPFRASGNPSVRRG